MKVVKLVTHPDYPKPREDKLEAEMLLFGPSADAKQPILGLIDLMNERGLRRFIDSAGDLDHSDCTNLPDLRAKAKEALYTRPGPFLLNLFSIENLPGEQEPLD